MDQEKPLEDQELSKDELTLAEYPLGLVARRVPKGVKTLEYEEWVTVNGKRQRRFWQVTGSDAYGLPTGGDQDIFIAIFSAWQDAGFKDKHVPVQSIYNMLKRLDLALNKENYQRFHTSVQTWVGVTYHTEHAIYDRKAKRWVAKHTFHLFEEAQFLERYSEKNKTIPLGLGYIRVSDFLYRLVQSGDLKILNLTLYRSLPTPLARRLYRYLDKQRYYGTIFSIGLRRLCLKLGFVPHAVQKYKNAELKRFLSPALDALKKEKFLEGYSYEKGTKDFKLVVRFTTAQLQNTPQAITAEQVATADILAYELEDIPSHAYYVSLARTHPAHLLYEIVSETKDADKRGLIRTTKGKFFTDCLKRRLKSARHLGSRADFKSKYAALADRDVRPAGVDPEPEPTPSGASPAQPTAD